MYKEERPVYLVESDAKSAVTGRSNNIKIHDGPHDALPSRLQIYLVAFFGALMLLPGLMLCQPASAQQMPQFNPSRYKALADVDSSATIAPGTRISLSNWRQYKSFMPIGLQELYSQKYFWKVPSGPDFVITIGPTIPIPMPKKYGEDTEKGAGQAKLVPAGTGGYNIVGYHAGLPFPKPTGPLTGYELMFDNYYQYQPAVLQDTYTENLSDQYNNQTSLLSLEIQTNLGHVSDVGYPVVRPEAEGAYLSIFNQVQLPEQSKYTTELAVIRDNPNLPQEIYVFLPSLRRSLRLSSAARCSPLLGSDFVTDDDRGFSGLTNQFTATFLGRKRILNLMHMDRAGRHDSANWLNVPGMIGWPKPVLGTWELRDTYIYNLQPAPSNKGYCYGSKVMYMDAQTDTLLFVDIYDHEQKFWKCFTSFYSLVPINDGSGSEAAMQGDTTSTMFDFQNKHASFAWTSAEVAVNHGVPARYQNASLYAQPGGLDQVMR
jgi:hypothetical protein